MNEEDKKMLDKFINKKEEILEFKEIKAIVKLLLEINNKLEVNNEKRIIDKLVAMVPLEIYDFDTDRTYKGKEVIEYIANKIKNEVQKDGK